MPQGQHSTSLALPPTDFEQRLAQANDLETLVELYLLVNKVADDARGRILTAVKQRAGHGQWLPTLKRLGLSPRRAQELMALGRGELPAPKSRPKYAAPSSVTAHLEHLEADLPADLPADSPSITEPTTPAADHPDRLERCRAICRILQAALRAGVPRPDYEAVLAEIAKLD